MCLKSNWTYFFGLKFLQAIEKNPTTGSESIAWTLSSDSESHYPIANRRLWFQSMHPFAYFTGTFH